MPNYDYKCPDCGTEYSTFRGINEKESEVKCSKCNSIMKRIFAKCNIGITHKGNFL